MEEETWKDIEGWEGFYQVSSLGRVRSVDREIVYSDGRKHSFKGKIMKPHKDRGGYLYLVLSKEGNRKTFKVHRLVAEAFLPNPDNLPQVNHIHEFDKTDNRVESLEWCSASYNINYGTMKERLSISNRNNPKQSKIVYQYTLDGKLVKIWPSLAECVRNGFDSRHISKCCIGKRRYKTHKGFKWSYKPLEPSE